MNRRVHFVGIGGAGLSAIAHVLHDRGEHVTGSDMAISAYVRALEAAGIEVNQGHAAEHVIGADLVIVSSAIPDSNIELTTASQMGIPVLRRRDFLTQLTEGFETIAIAGTHGKTTTSGLIAWMLDLAEYDPSFIVGGLIADFGVNGKAGSGRYFVIEADEYDHAFLGLFPSIAVVTNVEFDHPDCYPTMEDLQDAFTSFADQVKDRIVVCASNPGASSLKPNGIQRTTYAVDQEADWRAEDVRPNAAGGMDFLVIRRGELLGLVRNRIPGLHNVENALAAMAVVDDLDVPFSVIRQALTTFHGARQRFEVLGIADGVTVVDDYAHHPTEIRATLSTAKLRYPDAEVWAVFQPHTYSRIRALEAAFLSAFQDADHVIVTEVFAAREEPNGIVSGESLARKIEHRDVHFMSSFEEISSYLASRVRPGDVVVTLSAGDANRIGKLLLEVLRGREKGSKDA